MFGLSKRESRLVLFGLLGWGLFLAMGAGWLLIGPGSAMVKGVVERWNPPRPKQSELSKPLQKAIAWFWKRGGKYIWGSNDCSVFVLDYLKARGAPVTYRMTTYSMSNPREMEALGYRPGRRSEAKEFVFVARYQNDRGEWRGHTGVGTLYKGHLWYVHNASGSGGVVLEEERAFGERMRQAGASLDRLQYYLMR